MQELCLEHGEECPGDVGLDLGKMRSGDDASSGQVHDLVRVGREEEGWDRGAALVGGRDLVGVRIDLESAKVDEAAGVAGALHFALNAPSPMLVESHLAAIDLKLPDDALIVLEAPRPAGGGSLRG